MNRKIVLILALSALSFVFGSCLKSGDAYTQTITCPLTMGSPSASEIASLQTYLNSHAISAVQDSTGFFYIITNPGTGSTPTTASYVTVKYSGTLENGFAFDQNLNGYVAQLGSLILGWQLGLPLIKKGGAITLFLPPSLGYGCNALPGIPASSNLIFTIELVDVQ
ncbi:MAG TPA: FKBP-type peptidyl-prolyl cis-trans isomerase [Ferruginibacter sp.]|nr:FKBP-type peptidyl-prolyl cis-trans isomerase [Ferruginibacter sp.]